MSKVRPTYNEVRAIAISDLHLTADPPIARSVEKNWLRTTGDYLDSVFEKAGKHRCPILIPGDIFHKWNSPAALINFTIQQFRRSPVPIYAIPGQHDLPYHNIDQVHKSAYWTLVESGVINHLAHNKTVYTDHLALYGFPWQCPVNLLQNRDKKRLNIALIHAYCWMEGHAFPGVPKESHVLDWQKKLKGIDCALFGDNHKGFKVSLTNPDMIIVNCGTFMCRRADEKDYDPFITFIYQDGAVRKMHLQTNQDKWVENLDIAGGGVGIDFTDFVEEFQRMGDMILDFKQTCRHMLYSSNCPQPVKDMVIKAIGD